MEMRPLRELLAAKKTVQERQPLIGQTIRSARMDANLTQAGFAMLASVNPAYLHQIEAGSRSPSTDSLERIINVLETIGEEDGDSSE